MTEPRYCEIFFNAYQNSPLLIKKRRKGAIHTKANGSVDDLCGGAKQAEQKVYVMYFVVGAVYLTDDSGRCWLMTMKSSDSRFGWKGGKPSEDDDDVSSGEGDSNNEKEGDHLRMRDGRCQPGVKKLHRQGAPWKGNVS